jgi:trigger factor
MKIVVEQIGPCRKAIKVEVPADVVGEAYREMVAEFVKRARIPGFRPGKAPAAIVEKQFAKELLEETRERVVPRAYREALRQEKIDSVSIVDVSEGQLDKTLPLSFKVTVDVNPEFTLPEYKGIAIKSRAVSVKDEEVEQVVINLRERQARFEPVTGRAAGKGDVVEVDYVGACEGRSLSEVAPGNPELAEGKDFWVLVDETTPLFLPGLPAQLEGIEIGQTRTASVTFPSDYRVQAVAGKQADYTVTARGIRERKLPELNDEMLKMLGVQSAEDLRKKVRENLQEAGETAERNRQKDEIVKWIMAHTDLKDLPQTLVEEEARHIIQNVVQENVRRGVAKEQIEANREDIFTRAAESSSDRVRMEYILDRVADAEKVAVEAAEVEHRLAEMAGRYGMPPQQLRSAMEKRGSLSGLRHSLRMEKTVDLLLAAATVTPE